MLVDFPGNEKNCTDLSDKEKLQRIRGEVYSAIEDRIEELNREATKMKGTMEEVLGRISTQGFSVDLEDLKTGKWYKVATEIKVLQEVASFIEALS